MAAGYGSFLAPWLGGAQVARQAGFRSLFAPWMGGAGYGVAVAPPPTVSGGSGGRRRRIPLTGMHLPHLPEPRQPIEDEEALHLLGLI